MHTRIVRFAFAVMVANIPWPAHASFQGLGQLLNQTEGSTASRVSADGAVVVGYCDPAASCSEAWVWDQSNAMVGLGFLGSDTSSFATDVSADGGVVVGTSGVYPASTAVFWDVNGVTDLGAGGDFSLASGTSSNGSVAVGNRGVELTTSDAYRLGGSLTIIQSAAFPDQAFAVDVSSDGITVTGYSGLFDDPVAWIWTSLAGRSSLPELVGNLCQCGSSARAISDDGTTVVGDSHEHAFRWTQAQGTIDLGLLPGAGGAIANDVSADGSVVVGDSGNSPADLQAFLWDATHGMRELRALLVAFGNDLNGWTLKSATGVSANGLTITGYGTNPSGKREAWLASIPSLDAPAATPAMGPGGSLLLASLLVAVAAGVLRVKRGVGA